MWLWLLSLLHAYPSHWLSNRSLGKGGGAGGKSPHQPSYPSPPYAGSLHTRIPALSPQSAQEQQQWQQQKVSSKRSPRAFSCLFLGSLQSVLPLPTQIQTPQLPGSSLSPPLHLPHASPSVSWPGAFWIWVCMLCRVGMVCRDPRSRQGEGPPATITSGTLGVINVTGQ